MLCINSPNSDPYFNLAAEEYLLKSSEQEFFMLWQSTPVIVTGKHQNVLAEINYRYAKEHGIQVARRLTGGGTVFHDAGNLNFTFIRNGEPGKLVDFTSFIAPVIELLGTLQIEAVQGPKHEILAGGLKISGNAEHVHKNRVLHHGTLLFDADLDMLRKSISRDGGGTYTDRAVQSNRSSVINLSEILPSTLSVADIKRIFMDHILGKFSGMDYTLNDHEILAVNSLAKEKYRTWEWIYGWSPDYTFKNTWKHKNYEAAIELSVHRGFIQTNRIGFSVFEKLSAVKSEVLPQGMPHHEAAIRKALISAGFNNVIPDNGVFEDLVMAFF